MRLEHTKFKGKVVELTVKRAHNNLKFEGSRKKRKGPNQEDLKADDEQMNVEMRIYVSD